MYFIKPQNSIAEIQPARGLDIRLGNGDWPGIALEEPSPDWSAYQNLVVELTNPGNARLTLSIRVHDRVHTMEMDDRYTQRFELEPRSSKTLRIPVSAIRAAPKTRRMDLSRIAGIIIFGSSPMAGYYFRLHEIRLE